jgi:hypothetical protein
VRSKTGSFQVSWTRDLLLLIFGRTTHQGSDGRGSPGKAVVKSMHCLRPRLIMCTNLFRENT